MKVLFLGSASSVHVRRPLMQLLDRGVDVVYAGHINPLPNRQSNYRFEWYPLFGKCIYRKLGHALGDYLALRTYVPILRRIHTIHRPDVTHVHWVDCHSYYCVKADIHPLVLSVWGSDINNCFELNPDLLHNQKVGIALSRADRVIIDSSEMINKCNHLANTSLKNIELLHLGIDTVKFSDHTNQSVFSLKQEFKVPVDARVIFSARAFSQLYQQEKILEAFARALPRLNKKTILILKMYNESDTRYYERISALIEQLEIGESVFWVRRVPDSKLPALYHLSDVIINFPMQDTFPVTFLEAATSEKPVITNCLPSYENTFAGEYFRMIKKNNVEDLAQAIYDELDGTPTPRENLIAAHYAVVYNYSEPHYMTGLLRIYEDLLSVP